MKLRDIIFFSLLHLSPGAVAQELPTTVEWDLVFPRQDETYKRVEYFPIVFAIRNAPAVWSAGLQLSWTLYERNSSGAIKDVSHMLSSNNQAGPPTTNPFYYLNATAALNQSSATTWMLEWVAGTSTNCTKDAPVTNRRPSGRTTFSISDLPNAMLPDISSAERCPQSLGAITINGIAPFQHLGGACPIISDILPGDPCSLKLDTNLNSQFTAEVSKRVAGTRCSATGTYPSITAVCSSSNRGAGVLSLTILYSIIVLSLFLLV
jgi:hypothetical protein